MPDGASSFASEELRSEIRALCEAGKYSTAHIALIHQDILPEIDPELWAYLARRAQAGKEEKVAHAVRRGLWEARVWTGDLALREAEYFLDRGEHSSASFVIKAVFGTEPDYRPARLLLARCKLQETQAQSGVRRDEARRRELIDLAYGMAGATLDEAMIAIDLLRFSDQYSEALKLCRRVRATFPDDARLAMREARILELLNRFETAIDRFEAIAESSPRYRTEALFKVLELNNRLDRPAAALKVAALLVLEPLKLSQQLKLALTMNDQTMVGAVIEVVADGGYAGAPIDRAEGAEIAQMLLDNGDIGLLALLRRRRVPIGRKMLDILDENGFSVNGTQTMPEDLDDAARIRSPDFMVPLDRYLGNARRPAGWPGAREIPERILLVTLHLAVGGAERQFLNLVKALIREGLRPEALDVAFFSLAADRGHGRLLAELRRMNVRIHDLRQRVVANVSLPGRVQALTDALPMPLREDCEALWHLANEIRPDVIHGWQDRPSLVSGLVGKMLSTERIVLSFRNMSPRSRRDPALMPLRALYRDLAESEAIRMTVNARAAMNDYAEWIGCDPAQFDILANSLDTRRYVPPAEAKPGRDGEVSVAGVFRLMPNKRPELWLRTVAALRDRHGLAVRPRMYGNGPLREEVVQLAESLGLEEFELFPHVTDPRRLYREVDFLLLMSRVEGVPNVVIEAQACGLPVAACDAGGTSEAMAPDGLLLVTDTDADAAADRIAAWLPGALKAPMADRVGFARQGFDLRAIARKVEALYCGT